ncbi:kinase-like domain-containing protein [Immersiella caudata]|uniref:Kinase-like domain-containing protein n=1 Tax=Immersiella caudata TaxID=314043 RepID=A0AA39X530_9PEZI|nr:kinase-like domain-containing protein [Immersiella caudata]
MASSDTKGLSEKKPVAYDQGATQSKYVTFYLVTPEDKLYFGQLFKPKKEITLDEYNAALEYVPDSEIYPERPGLNSYKSIKGSNFIPKGLLEETIIMEQISKTPHPNIIKYLGCRIRRGRITSIVLERLDQTLMDYIHEPEFAQLDKGKFVDALESAVAYLHKLGLAHNDINPYNIMIKDGGIPILIDFGSCQPFGGRL